MRSRRFPTWATLAAAMVVVLASCAPFAQFTRDLLDTTDGASLTYQFRTSEQLPGVHFHPGDTTAMGVVLVITGGDLLVLHVPEGVSCEATETVIDCHLGDVSTPVAINLTGLNVLASATYRRAGANAVLQTFIR